MSEALDQPAPLPLLQVALTELFDRRSGATITTDVYEEIGGLAGSVAHQAETVYASFAEADQVAVRRLFARLVTAGDGSEDTRRRARHSELTGISDEVVTALVERRLLTVDRDRESREPTVEVAHEALLRSWPRLREWLDEDRDWLRELRGLAGATRLWVSSGRDEADLYRGARLAVISELVRDRADALTPEEREFVGVSQSLADAELIAIEERALVRERQNRRLRRSLVGLGVVVVAALFAGGIAVVQSRRADDSAALANQQAALAEQRSAEAEEQREAALAQQAEAERQEAEATRQKAEADAQRREAQRQGEEAAEQRDTAEAAQIAAERSEADAIAAQRITAIENLVSTSLLQRGNRQDLAALLAIEAYRLDADAGRSALFSTFTRNVGFVGYRPVDDAEAIITIVPTTEDTALAALDGGRLARIDLETGSLLATVDTLDPGDEPYDRGALLRLSDDRRVAVLAVQGRDALTWRTYDTSSDQPLGEPVTVPFASGSGGEPDSLVFDGFGEADLSHDGSLLAISGGAAGRVLVFDARSGALVGTLSVPPPPGWPIPSQSVSVLFGSDGTLFVGATDGRILQVDPRSVGNGELALSETIEGQMWSAELGLRHGSSDGRDYLITFGAGRVSRIDLPEGTVAWTTLAGSENTLLGDNIGPFDFLIPCRDVAVDAPRQRFYCDDEFGSIFEHDTNTGARTARSFDRQTGLTASLTLTTDGRELVSSSFTSNLLARWRLDGSGPIQRMIATFPGSFATWGYSPDGSHLISSGNDLFDPDVWDPVTGEMTDPLEQVGLAQWTANPDQLFVVAGAGGLYDTVTRSLTEEVYSLEDEGGVATAYLDPPHDRLILLWEHQIKVYDKSGTYIGPTIASSSIVADEFISAWSTPDGSAIGVSSFASGTRLHDATTGVSLDIPPVPLVRTVVGATGVGIGSTVDGRLHRFDPDTLELLAELPGTHGYAEEMYLSEDESILVVGNESEGIRIYDVEARTQIGDAIPYLDGSIGLASLRPDGMELAIATGEPGIAIWDLDPAHWLDAACALAGRNLTQAEWNLYIGDLAEYHESCPAPE